MYKKNITKQIEQAENFIITWGKYKDKKLAQVIKEDWKYVERLLHSNSLKFNKIKKHIKMLTYGNIFK